MEENNYSKIIDVDIDKEMKKSFLDYSMSVIVARALPDVRDGLKPVHRRILYTLFENNLGPDKAYRKCADTVGSVLGRYHPHGDASVYDALVRLAQNFSMRYVLVDGHGNFGSVDGDTAAAYRYTESRMSKIAVEMLTDIDKDTVDYIPNYDDRLKEPIVLPSRYPNLLVNGSTGIAVGMATNIPPHNLEEIINTVCYLIDNPEAELIDLMKYIKGPDFPTGGIIMGKLGIESAYNTGRGKIILRAKAEIIEKSNRNFIIVTELPYQVNKAKLIENIADLIKEKRIEGISNIEDHSDRNGMHIEILLKRDASPSLILNQLYNFSQLQVTFGVIMLSIVNGEPKILNLKQILQHYINFQVEVLTRRTKFELKKAEERAYILKGLEVALNSIDKVIEILKSVNSSHEGKLKLSEEFGLKDVQTQAIIQMPLSKLTKIEQDKTEKELISLSEKIINLKDVLLDRQELLNLIKKEMLEIKDKFLDVRRTEIVNAAGEVSTEDLIPEEDCVLTVTTLGYIKRQKMDSYKIQHRGGRGISGMTRRDEDIVNEMFITNTHDYLMFFTDKGRVYTIKAYEVPECSRASRGLNIANLLPLISEEKITSVLKITEFEKNKYLVMLTKFGVIKRTSLINFSHVRKTGIIALDLDEGDVLNWVRLTNGEQELILATKKGKSIRCKETDIRCVGRTARGVKAITLKKSCDCLAGLLVITENTKVLTVSETGYGRISEVDNYRVQARGGQGTINYHVEKYGDVASINSVNVETDDIIVISSEGIIIRIKADTVRICARPSKGVKIMRTSEDNKVVAVACIPEEDILDLE
ncbi:MAG: DNA gyrase subunit A [Candidatus Paraimprobicoccus trichonymphae]|uniref:DNA gyrase subunit A n=1 Tax=Candidatus Paraimprobicoccus trichonymphae TaxID=3033793 RepID=A0AA48HVW3_9FIRM|nr:MAG: DNA gyrase subunit A [Candidatus Paraimprobicoccus trichonymphae]